MDLMTKCMRCGKDITNEVKRTLNLFDDEYDLEIVCNTCYGAEEESLDGILIEYDAGVAKRLQGHIDRHRQKAAITCDDECWCHDAQAAVCIIEERIAAEEEEGS